MSQNIKTAFKNLFVKEPQKSLREAGITDTDDMITEDGQAVYLTYLLEKDTTFMTDVVAPIIEANKKDNK